MHCHRLYQVNQFQVHVKKATVKAQDLSSVGRSLNVLGASNAHYTNLTVVAGSRRRPWPAGNVVTLAIEHWQRSQAGSSSRMVYDR
jgi:hypothetical protein